MVIRNKIYNSFGSYESFAARLTFVLGCILIWFSLKAILLIVGGAFFGFTYFCTLIDIQNQRVSNGDRLFGLFRTGKWIALEPEMTVGIVKSHRVDRIFSWSNRALSTTENDFLIVLFDSNGKKILTLNRIEAKEKANEELFHLSDLLNLRRTNQ